MLRVVKSLQRIRARTSRTRNRYSVNTQPWVNPTTTSAVCHAAGELVAGERHHPGQRTAPRRRWLPRRRPCGAGGSSSRRAHCIGPSARPGSRPTSAAAAAGCAAVDGLRRSAPARSVSPYPVGVDSGALEREVKLEAGIGFRIPDLDGLYPGITARPQPEQHLQAVYVDTPDLRLVRNGLTLRHRSERSASPRRASGPSSCPRVVGRRQSDSPGDQLARPVGAGSRRRSPAWCAPTGARRRLGPVARLVTHRRRTLLSGEVGRSRCSRSTTTWSRSWTAGGWPPGSGRWRSRLSARRRVACWPRSWPGSRKPAPCRRRPPEAGAGDRVPGGRAARCHPVPSSRPPCQHGRGDPGGHRPWLPAPASPTTSACAWTRIPRTSTRPGWRPGGSARTCAPSGPFLPEDWAQETRAELGWVAEALGRARDADVLLERLRARSKPRAARRRRGRRLDRPSWSTERDAGPATADGFDNDRYGALLDRLAAAARELPPVKSASGESEPQPVPPPRRRMLERLAGGGRGRGDRRRRGIDLSASRALWRSPPTSRTGLRARCRYRGDRSRRTGATRTLSLRPAPRRFVAFAAGSADERGASQVRSRTASADSGACGRQWPLAAPGRAVAALGPDPADEALHEVRIRAKRLRYACEAVAEVVGRPAADLARAAADLQGVLGDFHDAIVGRGVAASGQRCDHPRPGPGGRPADRP